MQLFGSAYKIEVTVGPRRILMRAVGRDALRRSMHLLRAVREQADRHGLTRVLVDTTLVPQPVPDLDRYPLGEAIAGAWRGLCVAVVDPTASSDESIKHVATNRRACVRLFASEAPAIERLAESGNPFPSA